MDINGDFWSFLQEIVNDSQIVIDRPKGSHHPDFPEAPAYPLDYGFLKNTSSMDGEGIDCFVGSVGDKLVNGILCTVDRFKRDSEIKVLIGCSEDEMDIARNHLNKPDFFKAILIKR